MNGTPIETRDVQCDNNLAFGDFMKIALIIGYSFVGIASLLGNLIVVLIVACRREMRTVTNIFISSVSAADLVITAFSLWATPLAYYHQMWNFGQAMCYVVYVVQGASLMWAPMTLTAIAIDRYMLVANPFKKPMSNRACLIVIAGIWIGAFLVLTPMLSHVEYMEVGKCHKYCIEFWRPPEYRMAYGLSVLVIRSAIPLMVISWCHWRIACILNAQSNKLNRHRNNTLGTPSDIRRKQRLQTLLLAMVIIFAVSSLPIDLFNVLQDMEIVYHVHTVSQNLKNILFFISHWVAMAGTLLNPLVYAWWNENFRRQIKCILSEMRNGRQHSFAASFFEKSSRMRPHPTILDEQIIVLQVNLDEGVDDVHV